LARFSVIEDKTVSFGPAKRFSAQIQSFEKRSVTPNALYNLPNPALL
jgi:hypothetical protein